ncbi:hypothetical protein G6011_05784 [Alternaria panax]|uniref:Uncharacterized protein n=1 Tax=Alternaria panax TaxID=48097 RepID=A0AAD4FDJ5_9PLEO|nr:hypothetical protein G6011_05784 [Alternaria panax]
MSELARYFLSCISAVRVEHPRIPVVGQPQGGLPQYAAQATGNTVPFLAIVTVAHATSCRNVALEPPTSPATHTTSALFTFFALYLTTLFSLDTWAAARGSPYRAPGNNSLYRPAATSPAPDSYQGGMHGRGNAGPGPASGPRGRGRDVGRVAQARDSRPPIKMGGTAACGACLI